MTDEPAIRGPEQIRCECARKLRALEVGDRVQAIPSCLLG